MNYKIQLKHVFLDTMSLLINRSCCQQQKVVPMKTVHIEVCGLVTVTGTLFLENNACFSFFFFFLSCRSQYLYMNNGSDDYVWCERVLFWWYTNIEIPPNSAVPLSSKTSFSFATRFDAVVGVTGVTWCYTVLHGVTGVTWCYMVLHGVTRCYTVLHGVTWCYTVFGHTSIT